MAGYAPLNTLKPVADNIWIVDGPSIKFYGTPFSTRMTVVRLENGDIWLHSPTKICGSLRDEITALGPVCHLIAPNWIHYAYIAEWQKAYPKARAYAAPGVVKRARKHGMNLRFDEDLTQTPPAAWAAQIDQMIVEGSKIHREAVFFHKASKTLILTDLIENFEPDKLGWFLRILTKWAGIQDPDGQMPRDMRMTFSKHRDLLRASVQRMIDWGPERIILAHGRWYDKNAVAELKRSFRWVL
ncbi:MAG TPA: DUF4336 domain-containing protein [Rhodobacteraceae bacterium]|nr:DUF4336 domain-containing protein [Paracoccaceae bacterium]